MKLKLSTLLLALALTLGVLTLLTGCKQSPLAEDGSSTVGTKPPAQSQKSASPAENDKKTSHQISARERKVLSIPCGDEARIDISLPAGAVEGDVTLELTPLQSGSGEGWLAAGFHLNEAGKGGLELRFPACISYVASGELPENASIVKYADDGKGYMPVPSQRFKTTEAFGLIAYVDGFSAYGVKTLTDAELRKMADEMQAKGFNWVLEVDDTGGFTEGLEGEVTYEAYLNMVLVNSEAPSSVAMNGPYSGFATMQQNAVVTIEGAPFGFSKIEARDDAAAFTLYPVFKQFLPEAGSGLAPLSGLVPIGYEGKGVLHMKNPVDIGGVGGEDGLNMLEVARQMEAEWGMDLPPLQDEDIPFTVVTDGPVAYITLTVSHGVDIALTGSIVGYSKGQRPELAPLEAEGQKKDPPPKTEGTQYQDENGTIHYDLDGDGQTDFSLFPLNIK